MSRNELFGKILTQLLSLRRDTPHPLQLLLFATFLVNLTATAANKRMESFEKLIAFSKCLFASNFVVLFHKGPRSIEIVLLGMQLNNYPLLRIHR